MVQGASLLQSPIHCCKVRQIGGQSAESRACSPTRTQDGGCGEQEQGSGLGGVVRVSAPLSFPLGTAAAGPRRLAGIVKARTGVVLVMLI